MRNNGHFVGKFRQEQAALASGVPVTVVRAAQFFEFPEMILTWSRDGDTAAVPPLLVQPAAARDVAGELADLAVGEPAGGS